MVRELCNCAGGWWVVKVEVTVLNHPCINHGYKMHKKERKKQQLYNYFQSVKHWFKCKVKREYSWRIMNHQHLGTMSLKTSLTVYMVVQGGITLEVPFISRLYILTKTCYQASIWSNATVAKRPLLQAVAPDVREPHPLSWVSGGFWHWALLLSNSFGEMSSANGRFQSHLQFDKSMLKPNTLDSCSVVLQMCENQGEYLNDTHAYATHLSCQIINLQPAMHTYTLMVAGLINFWSTKLLWTIHLKFILSHQSTPSFNHTCFHIN